jgi:hypothetical protein
LPAWYTSRNCHPSRRRRSRGETAPAMDVSPGGAALRRETLAPAGPTPAENGATATGAHARAESVDLFPAAIVRLKCALHRNGPREKGWFSWLGHERRSVANRGAEGQPRSLDHRRRLGLRHRPMSPSFSLRGSEARAYIPALADPRERRSRPEGLPSPLSLSTRPCAIRFTEALNAVSGSARQLIFSGRNVASKSTLRPFRLVDKSGENPWRGCVDMGTER